VLDTRVRALPAGFGLFALTRSSTARWSAGEHESVVI